LQHGADAQYVGATLYGFVGGFAGVQVGEDEHVGLAGYFAVGRFLAAYAGHAGGVVLQRAVDEQVGAFFLRQAGGFFHFFHIGAAAGGAGGVGNHGHFGIDAEGFGGFGRLDGDVGQLFGGGLGVHGAVAIHEHLLGHQHEEHAGH